MISNNGDGGPQDTISLGIWLNISHYAGFHLEGRPLFLITYKYPIEFIWGYGGLKSENSLRILYGVFLHCTSRCNKELGMGQSSSRAGFCNSKLFSTRTKRSIIARRSLYTAY